MIKSQEMGPARADAQALDAAVFGAYGWPSDRSDADLLERLLSQNLDRSSEGSGRARVDDGSNNR